MAGPEGFHNGSSYSEGIDNQGLARIRALDQVANTPDNLEVSSKREGFDVAQDKAEFALKLDGIAATAKLVKGSRIARAKGSWRRDAEFGDVLKQA